MSGLLMSLLADLWALVAAVVVGAGVIWTERRRAKVQAVAAERARQDAETLDRISAGQKAGAKAASSGKTDEQILRENDGRWQ